MTTFAEQGRIDAMKTANLWVFVNWEPSTIEALKASRAYRLWEKSITNPKSLTRDEKDWLADQFMSSTYNASGNCIPVGGWMMRFPTAKKYLVQNAYSMRDFRVYYAFDKTSLRNRLGREAGTILEYPEKSK